MHILITGGTGLIGGRLLPALRAEGHTLTVLSRTSRASTDSGLKYLTWNGRSVPTEAGAQTPVDAIINLAGAGVADHRWTDAYKKLLKDSRVHATQACVAFIKAQHVKPRVLISGSAVGVYGTHRSTLLTEADPAGKDMLSEIGTAWEAAAQGAGVRTVIPRIGVVLAHEGGAFPKLMTPFKLFAGGPVGTGKQGFPWVHIDDVVGFMLWALTDEMAQGVYNLVGPEDQTNNTFSHMLGRLMNRPSGLPVPTFAIKLMLGEQAMLVTEGQRVSAARLQQAGYLFKYPTAESAVREILTH